MSKGSDDVERARYLTRCWIKRNEVYVRPGPEGKNIRDRYKLAFDIERNQPGSIWGGEMVIDYCKRIVERAKNGERYAMQACLEAAATDIAEGHNLEPSLAEFVRDYLRSGANTIGAKKGRDPRVNLMRDFVIANAVGELREEFKIPPTRNEATKDRESGCSIVVDLLKEFQVCLTEAAVERIWKRCKDNKPETII
jgi:hypothetical protein